MSHCPNAPYDAPVDTELLAGIADRTEAGLLVRVDWDEGDTWSVTWIEMPDTRIAPVLLRGPSKW